MWCLPCFFIQPGDITPECTSLVLVIVSREKKGMNATHRLYERPVQEASSQQSQRHYRRPTVHTHIVLPLRLRRLFCSRTTSSVSRSMEPEHRPILSLFTCVRVFLSHKQLSAWFRRKSTRRFMGGGGRKNPTFSCSGLLSFFRTRIVKSQDFIWYGVDLSDVCVRARPQNCQPAELSPSVTN